MNECPIAKKTDKIELIKMIQELNSLIKELTLENIHIKKDRDFYKNKYSQYRDRVDSD